MKKKRKKFAKSEQAFLKYNSQEELRAILTKYNDFFQETLTKLGFIIGTDSCYYDKLTRKKINNNFARNMIREELMDEFKISANEALKIADFLLLYMGSFIKREVEVSNYKIVDRDLKLEAGTV